MKHYLLRFLALATVFTLAGSARASIVTYQFSGTVSVYSPTSSGLPASIHVGSTATGTFSYDNAAPGSMFYRGAALRMTESVTIDNTYTFSLTTTGSGDEIDVFGGTFGFYKRGPDVTLDFAPSVHLSQLEDFGFGATSTDLSTATVLLEPGATVGISDPNSPGQPYYYIGINVTSLQQVAAGPVPEPGSLLLCATGVVTVAGYGWRRRRRRAV